MEIQTFPAKAWLLMPSCKIRRVTIVEKNWYGRYVTDKRTHHDSDELFRTHKAATKAGAKRLEQQRERHAKAALNIEKRAANLDAERAKSE